MPPTSRKTKLTKTRNGRVEIEHADGWTTVTTTRARHRPPATRTGPADAAARPSPEAAVASEDVRSVEDLDADHLRYRAAWEASECRRRLELTLCRPSTSPPPTRLDRCVCLGLGSLASTSHGKNSLYQLACLLSVLDVIGTRSRLPCPGCAR